MLAKPLQWFRQCTHLGLRGLDYRAEWLVGRRSGFRGFFFVVHLIIKDFPIVVILLLSLSLMVFLFVFEG